MKDLINKITSSKSDFEIECLVNEHTFKHIDKDKNRRKFLDDNGYYRRKHWVKEFGVSRQTFFMRIVQFAHKLTFGVFGFYKFPDGFSPDRPKMGRPKNEEL